MFPAYTRRLGHKEATFHVWVNTFTDASVDLEKTFVLSFKSKEAAAETEALLKKTVANCQREVKLRKDHAGHNYQKLRGKGSFSESCRARCADPNCHQLLLGLLFTGVECLTCKEIYHTECISEEADNIPASQEYFEDLNNPNIVKPDDLTTEDMSLGEASRQEAARALKGRRPGTFLLRQSKTNYSHMLAVKTFEKEDYKKIRHVEINKIEIHGREFFYLEKGVCAGSILDLIHMHRTTYKLYTPIHVDVISEESVKMEETSLRESDSIQSDKLLPCKQGPAEAEKAHVSFFHGDITSVEASSKLKDEQPGSFLLRGSDDTLKLSWKRQNGKVIHAGVKREGDRYSLVSKKTFPTIQEMVSFYQNIERDHKLALGEPLLQEAGGLLESQVQNTQGPLQEPERNFSIEEQLAQLPYYRGVMSEGEIATTLQSQPDGVFLLATDPGLGDVFIYYRKNQRTLHLKIEQDNNLDFGVETWEMGRLKDCSISGLVLALQKEGVLLEPFLPRVYQHAQSAHGLWKSRVKEMNLLTRWQTSPGSGTEYDTDDSEVSRVTQDSLRQRSTLKKVESEEDYENTFDHHVEAPPFPVLGQMTKRDAEKVLFDQPDNTWVLRYNNLNQETISVRKPEKVIHMKLYHSEGGVSLHSDSPTKPLDCLIRELQQGGKLGEQLTRESD